MRKYLSVGRWLPVMLFISVVLSAVCVLSGGDAFSRARRHEPLISYCEYSRDGTAWHELNDGATLSALEGDLWLRFETEKSVPQGESLCFMRDHIHAVIHTHSGATASGTECGREWDTLPSPGISEGEAITVCLHNPHAFGNAGAYMDFIDTLHIPSGAQPDSGMSFAVRACGEATAFAGALLMALALIFRFSVGAEAARKALIAALFALCTGCLTIFDSADISLISENTVLNAHVSRVAQMLAPVFAGAYVSAGLRGRARSVVTAVTAAFAAVAWALMALSLTGTVLIFDAGVYWTAFFIIPGLLTAVMFLCGLCRAPSGERFSPAAGVVIFGAAAADAVYSLVTGDMTNLCSKAAYISLFWAGIFAAAVRAVGNADARVRLRALVKELESARDTALLSQLRPHFIYNSLGAIRSLCRQDPERAWEAIGDFSGYLRGNMSAVSGGEIPFEQELRHIREYLRLEKLLAGDWLQVHYDIRATDFCVPPLCVQPIVENAVKHGLFDKEGTGNLYLSSRSEGEKRVITVRDDGVGFDVNAPIGPRADGSPRIGLSSVRRRVEAMPGAELEIESAPGAGTTVTITIVPARNTRGGT